MHHTPPSKEREEAKLAAQHATLAEVFKRLAAEGEGEFHQGKD